MSTYALHVLPKIANRPIESSEYSHARARAIAEYRHFERCLTRYATDNEFTAHCRAEMARLDARYNLRHGTIELI